MADRCRAARVGSVVWSILMGLGVIALGMSVIMPSTKRSRVDFRHAQELPADDVAATEPTTAPTTMPSR